MAGARPFENVAALLEKADRASESLGQEDWLEAFRAHPKIGEKKAAVTQSGQAQRWSAGEQAGVEHAAADTMKALATGNLEYERRFGFIFIVCASGRSSGEMLATLTQRLSNTPEMELQIAAAEQQKITRLRLEKLLNE